MMINILIAARLPPGLFAEIWIPAQLNAAAALGVFFSTAISVYSGIDDAPINYWPASSFSRCLDWRSDA